MATAKSVRNLILTLVILTIGIFVLTRVGKNFISKIQVPGSAVEFVSSIDSLSTLIMLGLGVLVIILIPVYLSKRSAEKKNKT